MVTHFVRPELEACELMLKMTSNAKVPDCMLWQGSLDEKGYGYTKVGRKKVLVHKYVALYYPEIPEEVRITRTNWYVVQKCGITICIKPTHLYLTPKKPEKKWEKLVKWWEPDAGYNN